MAKRAYAWIFNWGEVGFCYKEPQSYPRSPEIGADLFFSSKEKFEELLGRSLDSKDMLFPIMVPDDFDNWDFIPDNY